MIKFSPLEMFGNSLFICLAKKVVSNDTVMNSD